MRPTLSAVLRTIVILLAAVYLAGCSKPSIPKGDMTAKGIVQDPEAGTNSAAWKSQNPEDESHMEAGSEFDVTWYLINTGTTTWTTEYSLRYFAGTNLTKPGKSRYNLSEPVAPGEVGACSVDAVAPWDPGTYQMYVVLSDENDVNFSKVDITIVVD